MRSRHRLAILCAFAALAGAGGADANGDPRDRVETRRAIEQARAQSLAAGFRADLWQARASRAAAVADRTAQATAAVAAGIQQVEAEVTENEARIRLIQVQKEALRADLAQHQQPLVRLAAALELLARRPTALALFRPGSVIDIVHIRALIAGMIPEVQRRTAALRNEIARSDALQQQMQQARLARRDEEDTLARRRLALATLETQQRLAVRDVSGSADREAERALALAEQARDLGSLVNRLARQDNLRAQLAALPGPLLRPDRPGQISRETGLPLVTPAANPISDYILPLTGRLVAGFGDSPQGARSSGISIAAQAGGQVVAPAAGRVAFAGPYRGYGRIVIVAHDAGWTSLVTGLAKLDVRVGDMLVAGAPLGVAGPGRPVITLELRHEGKVVDPLDYVRR